MTRNIILRWFRDARYWIMYRTMKKHAYHIIDTRLKPGYADYDTRMLHGMFALLDEYIDEMGGADALVRFTNELRTGKDAEWHEKQIHHQDEAVRLSHWWNVERPADLAKHDALIESLYGVPGCRTYGGEYQTMLALDEKTDNDEQLMLKRLIDIRPSLWI